MRIVAISPSPAPCLLSILSHIIEMETSALVFSISSANRTGAAKPYTSSADFSGQIQLSFCNTLCHLFLLFYYSINNQNNNRCNRHINDLIHRFQRNVYVVIQTVSQSWRNCIFASSSSSSSASSSSSSVSSEASAICVVSSSFSSETSFSSTDLFFSKISLSSSVLFSSDRFSRSRFSSFLFFQLKIPTFSICYIDFTELSERCQLFLFIPQSRLRSFLINDII